MPATGEARVQRTRNLFASVCFLVAAAAGIRATGPGDDLLQRLDRIFAEAYPPTGPGAAVIVLRDGKPILRKGYGLANVELSVPVAPEMVFRVGSVTKEFTSAAILKLVEAGKISLSDDVSRFLPDYPTRGRKITVEQLLSHTSGIRSFTDMPSWRAHMREDWTVSQSIAFFENEPFEFEPGTRFKYCNSGYDLLGAIVEKVSGKTYGDFVAETIFQPLGMLRTRYGAEAAIISGRAEGYVRTPEGIVNAPYISSSQAYAAGALMSNVDDLARWQAALDHDGFLSAESRRRMWTPAKLPDGTDTRYGLGWIIWKCEGHAVVEHGGAINGFLSANMRWPDDGIYVAVLSNSAGPGAPDPRMLALRAASLTAGVPVDQRKAEARQPASLERYAGIYKDGDGEDWTVRLKGEHLEVEHGSSTSPIFGSGACADCFFYRDHIAELRFQSGASGQVTTLWIDEFAGPPAKAIRH